MQAPEPPERPRTDTVGQEPFRIAARIRTDPSTTGHHAPMNPEKVVFGFFVGEIDNPDHDVEPGSDDDSGLARWR